MNEKLAELQQKLHAARQKFLSVVDDPRATEAQAASARAELNAIRRQCDTEFHELVEEEASRS